MQSDYFHFCCVFDAVEQMSCRSHIRKLLTLTELPIQISHSFSTPTHPRLSIRRQ